jgi:SAM-dependent methyltransferase
MNEPNTPLHQMNPVGRFSDRVEDYVKYRPSYPTDAIATILPKNIAEFVVADIGAGTGISSRLLAEYGAKVIAIEPNEDMRKAAEVHPLVEYRAGNAEATNLADNSVDLVTCFQSFHWFDPQLALGEFYRILKPTGQVAIVWNTRDRSDQFTSEYSRIVREASNHHPGESRRNAEQPIMASKYFVLYRKHLYSHKQELDLAGLIGRAMSTSYVPKEGKEYDQLIFALNQLFYRNCNEQGLVYLFYRTEVYLAKVKV